MTNSNINLTNSKPLNNFSGGSIWKQGFILRVLPKNETNSNDTVYPIPVFYDKVTGKILTSTLPLEIANEYKNVSFYDIKVTSGNVPPSSPPPVENQTTPQESFYIPNEWEPNLPQTPEFDSNSDPVPPTLEWDNDNPESPSLEWGNNDSKSPSSEDNNFWDN